MTESSLYFRLGGAFAIAAVVDHFSDAIVQNPIVGQTSENPAFVKMINVLGAAKRGPRVGAGITAIAFRRPKGAGLAPAVASLWPTWRS